jgi:hypothetical protein
MLTSRITVSDLNSIEVRVADAVERPVFDVRGLPVEVVAPTPEQRTFEKETKVETQRAIKEAVKEVR